MGIPGIQTRIFICLLLIAMQFYGANILHAQQSEKIPLDTLAENKMLDETIRMYEALLEDNPYSGSALSGLGQIAVHREDWESVKDYYERLQAIDPENLEAAYHLGMAFRESGKFKALLLRKWDWDKSSDYYEQVIKQDSSYQDVLYQYAILKRYRGNYTTAIDLVHRQIKLRPDIVEPRVRIFRMYRYFISHTNLEESIDWLRKQPGPLARWAMAEVWRRNSFLDKADSLDRHLLQNSPDFPKTPIWLSLAKIYAARDETTQVDSCFWKAVGSVEDKIGANLILEDIKYLLTDDEYREYQLTVTNQEKVAFFKKFWRKRNPLPAAPFDRRLAEHYKRLIYAEKNYEYDGFRTWFADPDNLGYLRYPAVRELNHEYNDIGLVYIRHGKPNDVVRTAGSDVPPNISWRYYGNTVHSELIFHFILGKSGNDWRFSPIVSHPAILSDRLNWGNIYHSMLQASPLEALQYREEMARMSRESVAQGLSTDRHTWPENIETFDFPVSIETFRAAEGSSRIDISYAVPELPEMLEKLIKQDDTEINIETGLALSDQEYLPLYSALTTDTIETDSSSEKVKFYSYVLPPDTYYVSVHVNPKGYNTLAGYKLKDEISDYSGPQLQLSDIQLAFLIEPATDSISHTKGGLRFNMNPSHTFERQSPIYTYVEIYNLRQNEQQYSQFSVDYQLSRKNGKKRGITNLFGLLGGGKESSISIRNERQEVADSSAEVLALDAAQLEAGNYELEITVTDEQTGETVSRNTTVTLK